MTNDEISKAYDYTIYDGYIVPNYYIKKMDTQIEKMKNCFNCKYYNNRYGNGYGQLCIDCNGEIRTLSDLEFPICEKWRFDDD